MLPSLQPRRQPPHRRLRIDAQECGCSRMPACQMPVPGCRSTTASRCGRELRKRSWHTPLPQTRAARHHHRGRRRGTRPGQYSRASRQAPAPRGSRNRRQTAFRLRTPPTCGEQQLRCAATPDPPARGFSGRPWRPESNPAARHHASCPGARCRRPNQAVPHGLHPSQLPSNSPHHWQIRGREPVRAGRRSRHLRPHSTQRVCHQRLMPIDFGSMTFGLLPLRRQQDFRAVLRPFHPTKSAQKKMMPPYQPV